MTEITNLMKLVRLGSWEVGLRIGWTLSAGAISRFLLFFQIDSNSQTSYSQLVTLTFNPC